MSSIEHPRSPELDHRALESYIQIFISRMDIYPKQMADGSFVTVHQPLNMKLIEAHLQGTITVGTYALDGESMAKWLCFDADTAEQWQALLRLADVLEGNGLAPYRELSRRGGHLWLFTPPLAGLHIRRFGRQLLAEHQIGDIEMYPKQDFLTTGTGSLVRLPLGIHRLTGRRYHFVTRDGQPLAPTIREQIRLIASPSLVPLPYILRVLARAPLQPVVLPSPAFQPTEETAEISLSERLKRRISVLEFVSRYVALDARNTGFCPFHDDQHKSFGVNDAGNYWNCFAGCGGGSLIDFWMKWRTLQGQDGSFTATITDLRAMLL